MKPRNMPGRKRARRERARAIERGDHPHNVDNLDMRFRVGRRFRDDEGRVIGVPDGFPKQHHEGGHPSPGSRPKR